MQDLRDKLLKAGLIDNTQKERVDAQVARKSDSRNGAAPKRRRRRKPRVDADAAGNNPSKLSILQAIEDHRVRGDTRGDEEFQFTLRDGRQRKLNLTREVAHGLVSGRFAIVEWGDVERHIIVEKAAVNPIREADEGAVRFYADLPPGDAAAAAVTVAQATA